jgi:hypothetical protein
MQIEMPARFACVACGDAVTPMGATLDAITAGRESVPSDRRERLFVAAWLPVAEAPCGSSWVRSWV